MDKGIISKEKLAENLFKIYKFGYYDETGNSIPDSFRRAFNEHVIKRIGNLYDYANYVIIESRYVEKEWKELIANHYINSSYALSLNEHVFRIHFLLTDKFLEEDYLGYITLRPIEEISIALSFVYYNWRFSFFDRPTMVMTFQKTIHYEGDVISIETYPLFSQDSIVTCCADVNVLMLTKYLYNKYNITNVNLDGILRANREMERKLPRKISFDGIKHIFNQINIPYFNYNFTVNSEFRETFSTVLNTYIESAIPIVLLLKGHAIQIIGYIKNDNDDQYDYIVYDDSGFLADKISDNVKGCMFYTTNETRLFNYIEKINEDRIKDSINGIKKISIEKDKEILLVYYDHLQEKISVIVPIFDRVYIDALQYHSRVSEKVFRTLEVASENNEDLQNSNYVLLNAIKGEEVDIIKKSRIRSMIVDNSTVKKHFKQKVIRGIKEKPALSDSYNLDSVYRFISNPLSHYVWYSEVDLADDLKVCVCADPTMYYGTADEKLLFMNLDPVPIDNEQKLSLLTEGKLIKSS